MRGLSRAACAWAARDQPLASFISPAEYITNLRNHVVCCVYQYYIPERLLSISVVLISIITHLFSRPFVLLDMIIDKQSIIEYAFDVKYHEV